MSEYSLAAVVLADWNAAESMSADVERMSAFYGARCVEALHRDPASAPAHAWIVEALHRNGIASPLEIDQVVVALRERAQLPPLPAYPLIGMESRYLCHRLRRVTGHTADERVDFRWPEWWEPRSYREISELVHAVFFSAISRAPAGRAEPRRSFQIARGCCHRCATRQRHTP